METFTTTALGKTELNTIEPLNIEAILKGKFHDYLARPARKLPLDGLIGHGILTADGVVWKRHRTLMKSSFSRKRLEDFSMYEDHVQNLIGHIPSDGSPVDLQELFFSLTMDMSTDHLFGLSCSSLAPTSELSPTPDFGISFDRAQRAAVVKFALGSFDNLRPQPQYWADTKRVRQYADDYIHKALDRTSPMESISGNLAESVTKSHSCDPPRKANVLESFAEQSDSLEEIRAGLLHLLVAGRDTTASLLSNLFISLAREPRAWRKLRAEVATLNGVQPDAATLKQMPYLRQCIDESLRCHPPVPWALRIAARDTTLPTGGGKDQQSPILVEEGTLVLVPLYCLHRHSDFWGADADNFVPERWDTVKPGYAYLPFLAGVRKCLGWEFAVNTAAYVLVRLVQQFPELETGDCRPWAEELGLTMTSANGARVILRTAACAQWSQRLAAFIIAVERLIFTRRLGCATFSPSHAKHFRALSDHLQL
ncbi:hypothetical protein LTR85_008544 [Meristemomyces frigidus]|nr:hypothetical protein LTR85_008544 [Meristemomyces frigidus]